LIGVEAIDSQSGSLCLRLILISNSDPNYVLNSDVVLDQDFCLLISRTLREMPG
jgi:hypothetical protein